MSRYGLIRKRPDRRDYRFTPPRGWTGQHIDLSGDFVGTPYDQGQFGSCVSNAVGAVVDYTRHKQGAPAYLPPARLFIYYQGRVRGGYPIGQDTGLQIRDGFDVLAKDGAPPETDWPYDITRYKLKPPAQAYADALDDQAIAYGAVTPGSIDDTIASGYPVVYGFDVYESFESGTVTLSGIVPVPDKRREQLLGGHAAVAVSTPLDGSDPRVGGVPGVKYRKTLNSWGANWGLAGWYWYPVSEFASGDASDAWAVTTMEDPHAPVPPGPGPSGLPAELAAALSAADADPSVAKFQAAKHNGYVKNVSARLAAILKAPRA